MDASVMPLTSRAAASNGALAAEVHFPRFPATLFTDRYLLIVPADQTRPPLSAIRSIAVGSTNPVKLSAVRAVLVPLAPRARIDSVAVASTVSDQPFGDDETIRGALARASAARDALGAELGIGIEGGVVDQADGEMRTCAWAVVVDTLGRSGVGGSLAMPLPRRVAEMIRQGLELGHAMDQLVGEHDTKRGKGAVGILTADLVDRQRAYEVLVSYALAPFLTPQLYSDERRIGITPVY
jgi:inosine/xanthosine triphosphatase